MCLIFSSKTSEYLWFFFFFWTAIFRYTLQSAHKRAISVCAVMWTHPSRPLWTVSTGSRRRWKWLPWWTLSHTVSPRSPSAWSACPSDQPAHSCICRRHTPQPQQDSISTASFHLSWSWWLVCSPQRGSAELLLRSDHSFCWFSGVLVGFFFLLGEFSCSLLSHLLNL